MHRAKSGWIKASVAASGLALLSGCGGGGGAVNSTPTPTTTTTIPTTTTTTTSPTTTPTPTINYNDAEYQRSNGASDPGAITAWNAGATGAGITIGVIDTGIAPVGTEFTGRVSSASRAFGSATSVTDIDGHGTAVAAVAAGGRDGQNNVGIAFNANILALRTDSSGSCSTNDGCAFNTSTLTAAVDYARTNGAKVINLSLGGSAAPAPLLAAIGRATSAGIIVVIAAGNDGDAEPDAFAQLASSREANGLIIIAGSHDAAGALSSFSDKAGSYGQFYLTALGDRVRAFDQTGTNYLYSGTSFATPAIAGAIALLAQAFPNLTAAQIVSLLYSSATDAGASGVDAVFGRGILNITRAFQPLGTTSLAGSAIPVTATDVTTLSSAMGDASLGSSGLARAIVLDDYGRAFSLDMTARIARQSAPRPLRGALTGNLQTTSSATGAIAITSTFRRDAIGEPWAGFAQRDRGAARIGARPVAATMTTRLSPVSSIALGFGQSGQALADRLVPDGDVGDFLATRTPGDNPGFAAQRNLALAGVQALGRLSIVFNAEQGTIATAQPNEPIEPGYAIAGIAARRQIGRLSLGLGVSTMRERGTLLGARLASAFGRGGATTRYLDLDTRLALGEGWSVGARLRHGWTNTAGGGTLASSQLESSAATLDIGSAGNRRRFAVRIAQPTRVTGGGLNLVIPVSYDYANGAIGYQSARLDLSPRGRERDVEANYGLLLGGGWLESNLFWRQQPGNIQAAPDDIGAALRYSLEF